MASLKALLPDALLRKSLREARDEFERAFLTRVLEEEGGNKTRAAKRIGMTRQGFQFRIDALGIRVERRTVVS